MSKLLASLMRNYFPKRPSGAPLHTLSKLYDVPVGFKPPPRYFEAEYCLFCGRRRVAVARYRMICLVLIHVCISIPLYLQRLRECNKVSKSIIDCFIHVVSIRVSNLYNYRCYIKIINRQVRILHILLYDCYTCFAPSGALQARSMFIYMSFEDHPTNGDGHIWRIARDAGVILSFSVQCVVEVGKCYKITPKLKTNLWNFCCIRVSLSFH